MPNRRSSGVSAQAEGLTRLAGEGRGVDPVRDVADPARIQPPDCGRQGAQALGRHDHRGAPGQGEPAQPDPAWQLCPRLLRAEAVDHVQMRADRADAISQRPFDRTPVVGQQEIRPLVAQNAAEGPQIGEAERAAFAADDRAQPQLYVATDERGTVLIAVATDHDMLEPLPERIGERREAN